MARIIIGTVSSDKANKTITVAVRTTKTHPIYKKQYTVTKRLLAHDEANEARVTDKVAIVVTRPISSRKHFKLSKIIEKAAIREEETVEAVTKAEEEVAKKPITTPTAKKDEKPTAAEEAKKEEKA